MLEPRVVQVVAIVALVAAVLAILAVLGLLTRLGRLTRALDMMTEGGQEQLSFLQAVEGQHARSTALHEDLRVLTEQLSGARTELADALRHVAVVRYDAFGDLGGGLSFSMALLDDAGDGVVLSSINGRSNSRTYAKGIAGGSSEHELSPEELQAIAHAMRTAADPASRGDLLAPARRPRRQPLTT